MSTHNICFHGEIRQISSVHTFFSGAMTWYIHRCLLTPPLHSNTHTKKEWCFFFFFLCKHIWCWYSLEVPWQIFIGISLLFIAMTFLNLSKNLLFLKSVHILMILLYACNKIPLCLNEKKKKKKKKKWEYKYSESSLQRQHLFPKMLPLK